MNEQGGSAPVPVGDRLLSAEIVTVKAVTFVRRVRGGSQGLLLLCDDGNYYVVKTLGNPQGDDILGAEHLAAVLINACGLPAATTAMVIISQDFLDSNPTVDFELPRHFPGARRPYPGVHFGSRLVGSPRMTGYFRDFVSEGDYHRVSNREMFLPMLVFDVWADNKDNRQAVFVSDTIDGALRASFIDHGFMFGSQTDGLLTRGHLYGIHRADSAYAGLIDADDCFDPYVDRLRTSIPGPLERALETIPLGWYRFDRDRLKDQLMHRLDVLCLLLKPYRDYLIERRNHGIASDPLLRRGHRTISIGG